MVYLELTGDLTKYLNSCVNKLCSKSKSVSELLFLLKSTNEDLPSAATSGDGKGGRMEQVDADASGRKVSVSCSTNCELSEATKWSYCSRLTDWLYHVSCGVGIVV